MSHDKGKTVEELGDALDSAESRLARLRDEIRVSESNETRKAHEQILEAEIHLEAARARYADIQNAGRVGDDEAERHMRKAYNDMSEAMLSALRYIG